MQFRILLALTVMCCLASPALSADDDGVYLIDMAQSFRIERQTIEGSSLDSFGNAQHWSTGAEVPDDSEHPIQFNTPCMNGLATVSLCKKNGSFQPVAVQQTDQFTNFPSWKEKEVCTLSVNGTSIRLSSNIIGDLRIKPVECSEIAHRTADRTAVLDTKGKTLTNSVGYAEDHVGSVILPGAACILRSSLRANWTQRFTLTSAVTRVGPLDSKICNVPPFRAVTLNPFWSYPNGAESIDLTQIAREIDAPGSTSSGTKASICKGPPLANGLATDGRARLIIGVRTEDGANPITFTIAGDTKGATLNVLDKSLFDAADPGVTTELTISPSEPDSFIPIPGESAWGVAVVLVAPETPKNFAGSAAITVTIAQEGQAKKETKVIYLYPPPVLLAHGIWSGPEAWDKLAPRLWGVPERLEYPHGLSFDDDIVQYLFDSSVSAALCGERQRGIVGVQVNAVGHSMGGLVTRQHVGRHLRKHDYFHVRNFLGGDINQLVTLDTPHAGSELPRFLLKNENVRILPVGIKSLPCVIKAKAALSIDLLLNGKSTLLPTLGEALKKFKMPIGGEIRSLVPDSFEIRHLPDVGTFPYQAVASLARDDTFDELTLNCLFAAIGFRKTIDQLLTANNDVIVSYESQVTDADAKHRKVFHGPTHTEIERTPEVADYVKCIFLNGSKCGEQTAVSAKIAGERRDFSLEGRKKVAPSNVELAGLPVGNLEVNNEYSATVFSSTRAIEGFVFAIAQENGIEGFDGDSSSAIKIVPTGLAPIQVSVLAAFTDNTYAIRTWSFPVDTKVTPTLVDIDKDEINLDAPGSIYQLRPLAYLQAPAMNTLDVTSLSNYAVTKGNTVVQVSPEGTITALKRGTATVKIAWKNATDTVNVIVGH
jgi:pimeloyl-ACP methyl ester carboxylesterase